MDRWKRQARASWLLLGAAGGVTLGVWLGHVRGYSSLVVVVPLLVAAWAKWPRMASESRGVDA